MQYFEAKPALVAADKLGEGPLWSAAEQSLYWVDVLGYRIRRWNPVTGQHRSWTCPSMPTALGEMADGGFIVTLFDGIYEFYPESDAFALLLAPEPHLPLNRCNDSKVGPDGRYWFGTMQNNIAADGSPVAIAGSTGSLYSLDASGTLKQHLDGVGISNTLAWSPAGTTFFFADSLAGVIRRYPFDPNVGDLGPGTDLPPVEPRFGEPDGSAMDAEGCLWNARWDGGCVLRFSPDGEVLAQVDLSATRPTCAVFGGPDLRTLYITSARDGLVGGTEHDGSVFAVDLPVAGVPANRFGQPPHSRRSRFQIPF